MAPVFKSVLNISIWFLFGKGILLVPVTIYTFARAYLSGETTPIVGIVSCAAGTFAFTMACIAIWLKHKIG